MATTNRREMIERAALQAGALVGRAGVRAMAARRRCRTLRSLLGHELLASHALMLQLTSRRRSSSRSSPPSARPRSRIAVAARRSS